MRKFKKREFSVIVERDVARGLAAHGERRAQVGELADVVRPGLEYFVVAAGISADAKRDTDVIEHDQRIRKSPGQIGKFGNLRVVDQRIEGKAVARQSREAGAEFGIKQKLGLPVKFVGVGEKPEDLELFDPDAYVEALFAD